MAIQITELSELRPMRHARTNLKKMTKKTRKNGVKRKSNGHDSIIRDGQTPYQVRNISNVLSYGVNITLFPPHLELVPQLNEVYELELAFYESKILADEEIIRNGAYFARVGNTLTRHFLICSGEPVRLPQHSSSRLRSFFQTNQFKTGYATHGLFPYRGKFHPQMIKGLINAMGLKPGDTVLDPMMGSGTLLIEARLMGIKSIGIDASPFCRFMAQVKLDALTVPLTPVREALKNSRAVYEHFVKLAGQPNRGSKKRFEGYSGDFFSIRDSSAEYPLKPSNRGKLPAGSEIPEVYNFFLLAYLDSAGYSERSDRKSPYDQFHAILERYLFVAEKIQSVLAGTESELAESKALEGDARRLSLRDSSVDGIIFSPPYSFAIDYLENDSFHLGFLGIDIDKLREEMIGLRGRTLRQKFELYKTDMERVISECARLLRPGRICCIVVGTNNNQLSKILEVSPDEVKGIDELLVELGKPHGLHLIRKLSRQITGMANTMRTEFIVMLQRR
jgi:SAM-dependent methyltransferase